MSVFRLYWVLAIWDSLLFSTWRWKVSGIDGTDCWFCREVGSDLLSLVTTEMGVHSNLMELLRGVQSRRCEAHRC